MSDLVFAKLRAKYEIIDYCSRHFMVYRDGFNRGRMKCIFHEDDTPSLVLYSRTQSYHCFGCHVVGDVLDIVAQVEGVPIGELLGSVRISESDYTYWKEILRRRSVGLSVEESFVLGCIALRSFPRGEERDCLLIELEEAISNQEEMDIVLRRILRKANLENSVLLSGGLKWKK